MYPGTLIEHSYEKKQFTCFYGSCPVAMLNDQRIKQTIYSDPASQPQVPLPSARWDLHNYGALHRGKKNGAQARKSRHDVAKTFGKHIGDHLSLSYERMSNDLSTPQWGKEKNMEQEESSNCKSCCSMGVFLISVNPLLSCFAHAAPTFVYCLHCAFAFVQLSDPWS